MFDWWYIFVHLTFQIIHLTFQIRLSLMLVILMIWKVGLMSTLHSYLHSPTLYYQ